MSNTGYVPLPVTYVFDGVAVFLLKELVENRLRSMEADKSYSNVRCSSTYQALIQAHKELSKPIG